MSAVQTINHDEPKRGAVMTPMDMLSQALSSGASVEQMSQLLALQERWEATQARKAFDAALANAKAEIPVILKTATGHNDKRYADFASIARVVDPIISRFGLHYRFRTRQDERINVTCILSHVEGHFEETTLAGPADGSGSKNPIQAIGSTLSYLQRYSLVQALGLAASTDDDGRASGSFEGGAITDDQVAQIRDLIDETGADIARFCRHMKVDAVPDIPAARFADAMKSLEAKRART